MVLVPLSMASVSSKTHDSLKLIAVAVGVSAGGGLVGDGTVVAVALGV